MSEALKTAKEALDHYRTPMPDDEWDYTWQYAQVSALISIAESLEKIAISHKEGMQK